jgi:hypothetical protein
MTTPPAAGRAPASRLLRRFTAFILFAACAGVVALTAAANRQHRDEGRPVDLSVSGIQVRGPGGAVRPLAPARGGVVLVLSTGCAHCHQLLRDWAAAAGPASSPGLHVIALEGADGGRRLLDSVGVAASVSGPAEEIQAFAARIGLTGTPLLLRVDARGRVLEKSVGVPSRDELAGWIGAAGPGAGS